MRGFPLSMRSLPPVPISTFRPIADHYMEWWVRLHGDPQKSLHVKVGYRPGCRGARRER